MVNVEDVGKQLIIIKKRHVQVVDFQQLLWEDLMDGVKSLELEEVKEPVEWDIWKLFPEYIKIKSKAKTDYPILSIFKLAAVWYI